MPYVSVWIDEPGCDATCSSARERDDLQAKIDEAARLLRADEPVAALQALTDDASLPFKSPVEIARQYEQWKTGNLAGFTRLPTAEAKQ